jgi:acetyl esterase/lipase
MAKADLSEDYQNSAFIPGGETYPDRWSEAAFDFRQVENAIGRARLNQSYGPHERHVLDLFMPAGRAAGLIVYVHGGYWMEGDKTYWSHFADGATKSGWAVAFPSYRLAPEARIAQITQDAAAAITHAATLVAGPIRLVGHSAGGHLVARMNCSDVALAPETLSRIDRIVPISPLADLRPLMQTDMNTVLALDARETILESPALAQDWRGIDTRIWVGADERPVFLDQARWLQAAWGGSRLSVAEGCHHFDIIDLLHGPDGAILNSLLE